MKTFVTYRDGAGPVEARIKTAVRRFYSQRQQMPTAIVVNEAELGAAIAACDVLQLKTPVKSTGGCLVPEVWLEVNSERPARGD